MSKMQQRTVSCGSCGKAFVATVYESLNTDYAIDVPERIMNGQMFRGTCARCGAVTNFEYDVLYHDLKHGTMIWVIHKHVPDYEKLVEQARSLPTTYTNTRIVSDMTELREKVFCLEYDRDDRIIELCKVFVKSQLLLQQPDFGLKRIVYHVEGKDNKELFTFIGQNEVQLHCELPETLYPELEKRYEQLPISKEFDGNFALVDTAWGETVTLQLAKEFSVQKEVEDDTAESAPPASPEEKPLEKAYPEIPHFDYYWMRIYHALGALPVCYAMTRDDIRAFVLSLSIQTIGNAHYNQLVATTPEKRSAIDRRLLIYSTTTPREVRSEWLLPDKKVNIEDPYIKRWVIFGDLLANPPCIDNYTDAPPMQQNFADVVRFNEVMCGPVMKYMKEYIAKLQSGSVVEPVIKAINSPQQKIEPQNDYKNYKMKPLDEDKPTKVHAVQQHTSKSDWRNTVIGLLAFVALVLLICYFVIPKDSSTPTATTKGNDAGTNPASNYYSLINDTLKGATPTATPKPALIYNGRKFITPDYSPVCPFEVNAGSDGDYYIYLKYQKAPTYSQESRTRLAAASAPYESDIAFIVKAGQSYELDVPIGVYKLYYATGKTFFNTSILFGDTTRYYESDELLTFNASGNYYNGHTITLYEVVNGNLDTDEISEKTFPTR